MVVQSLEKFMDFAKVLTCYHWQGIQVVDVCLYNLAYLAVI